MIWKKQLGNICCHANAASVYSNVWLNFVVKLADFSGISRFLCFDSLEISQGFNNLTGTPPGFLYGKLSRVTVYRRINQWSYIILTGAFVVPWKLPVEWRVLCLLFGIIWERCRSKVPRNIEIVMTDHERSQLTKILWLSSGLKEITNSPRTKLSRNCSWTEVGLCPHE